MTLAIDDFVEFHRSIHRTDPFDWQVRLLRQIVSDRTWPRTLDLPTGSGKTTCIDIALLALALDAANPPSERWCPRRIAMVVDRRVVVDQAAERGRDLLRALTDETRAPVVRQVAERLRMLSDAEEPLAVYVLRGGVPKDDGWARRPDQPVIIASTVDQMGSRLLMQGYGVTTSMRPVHTGLVANDTLLLLDEVHLSRPFAETIEQLTRLRSRFVPLAPPRFHFAFLSATPGRTDASAFRLTESEGVRDERLGRRLRTSKATRLVEVPDRAALEDECVRRAEEMISRHSVIAVILNRVGSAAKVARALRQKLADSDADVALLTGRMRPLDRDDVLAELRPRIHAGRSRGDGAKKVIVVGTQSIEAGADFDFDAIVTEAASLDALRQRFGRVDRLGDYHGRAEGVIVIDKSANEADPVYGSAMKKTATWLKANIAKRARTIDFGVLALPLPTEAELQELITPALAAPVLLPAYLDLWTQSSPASEIIPDVTLWLHGEDQAPADVQVIWRADIGDSDLSAAAGDNDACELLIERVSAIRPSALEALPLPIGAARRWLEGRAIGEISDVEGALIIEDEAGGDGLALRWSGDQSKVIIANELRPGDTIIVPSARGGARNEPRDRSFDPTATEPVLDLAERAALLARGTPMLRLHEAVLKQLGLAIPADDIDEARAAVRAMSETESGWRGVWLSAVGTGRRSFSVDSSERGWSVLEGKRISAGELRRRIGADEDPGSGIVTTTDPETSPFTGCSVPLKDHSSNVERWARKFAAALGFPEEIETDLALAAWLHDIGKADRRFQLMLRGGSEIDYYKDETLWAKSGMSNNARHEQRVARERSGYPKGARHEVQSVAMLERSRTWLDQRAHDPDLVLYLVGSHHGYCRPLAPASNDETPTSVFLGAHSSDHFDPLSFAPTSSDHGLYRLDSPLADRFWQLVAKYGWFDLCRLESVLRLADHRASEEEQQRCGS